MRNTDLPRWFNRDVKTVTNNLKAICYKALEWNHTEIAAEAGLCRGMVG